MLWEIKEYLRGTPSTRGIVGTWGYPGVAGPGGYPGVAGYGGYYPSWRHTQSKNYSGIAGNEGLSWNFRK